MDVIKGHGWIIVVGIGGGIKEGGGGGWISMKNSYQNTKTNTHIIKHIKT